MRIDVASAHGKCPNGSSYREGCRCDVCHAIVAHYQRNYRRRLAEKQWGMQHATDLVPIEPSLKAVTRVYRDEGLTLAEIARGTGLTEQTIGDILHQRRNQHVTRETEERILAAYGEDVYMRRFTTDRQLVPWEEHKWKLYALLAQGWTAVSLREVLAREGRPSGWLNHMSDRSKRITYRTVKQLDWLVEVIEDKPGPSLNNRGRMSSAGYFPLIHYTEDGKLIRGSLTPEQKSRLRSRHGASASRRDGDGPRPRARRGS